MDSVKPIIESLLFVSKDPLTIDRIRTVLPHINTTEIRQALNELISEYELRCGGFYIRTVAGGYQFCTRPEHKEWIKRLYQTNPPKLSKASLETLAIIAWKQPIIRSDIESIRGVDCGGVLKILLEKKLIRVIGRKEIPGRPLIYATTKHFLEMFDLKDIKDLPTPAEIEAYGTAIGMMEEPSPELNKKESVSDSQSDTQSTLEVPEGFQSEQKETRQ